MICECVYYFAGTSVTDYVIPFIHSAESRKEVSERILEFLSHFQEEATYGSDSSSSGLSYVAQGHVLTCFKILSSFLLVGVILLYINVTSVP